MPKWGPSEHALSLDWQRHRSVPVEGKRYPLEPGRLVRISGMRGKFKVKFVVENEKGRWLDCYEQNGALRSFALDRVTWISRGVER